MSNMSTFVILSSQIFTDSQYFFFFSLFPLWVPSRHLWQVEHLVRSQGWFKPRLCLLYRPTLLCKQCQIYTHISFICLLYKMYWTCSQACMSGKSLKSHRIYYWPQQCSDELFKLWDSSTLSAGDLLVTFHVNDILIKCVCYETAHIQNMSQREFIHFSKHC